MASSLKECNPFFNAPLQPTDQPPTRRNPTTQPPIVLRARDLFSRRRRSPNAKQVRALSDREADRTLNSSLRSLAAAFGSNTRPAPWFLPHFSRILMAVA